MDGRPVRVLMVEDDDDDFVLTREYLAEIPGGQYRLDRASTFQAGLEAIARNEHDVYLLDYRLDGHDGLELLREAIRRGCRAPLILMTGVGDQEVDMEAMRAGAADYLVKDRLNGPTLERSIRYAIERKKAEEALRAAREQLEQRVAERTAELSAANELLALEAKRKDEFLAMLGHELRNPLAPVRNALHVLRTRYSGDPVAAQMVSVMDRQVALMARLVDDLMDVSRITRGKIELRKAPVDLAVAVTRSVESVRPFLNERRHQLTVHLPPEPVFVQADVARLEQVLMNLLNNAAKYTEPGGHVTVTAGREGGQAVVRVRDNGIGIRREMLPRIFDLFQQADRVPGRVIEGLGIGLTLVRNLVELHGGTVSADSEGPGRGSEFTVRLPALAAPPSEAPAVRPQRRARPLRILVVDDNVDGAESMALVLRQDGHQVRVAHDGPAALDAARALAPEVVLLDIGLPNGMDGYEVARRLRALPGAADARLIALTGFGPDGDAQRSRDVGFDRYLTKPVDLAALNDLLARV
jgi:signal transduction histidine kinase